MKALHSAAAATMLAILTIPALAQEQATTANSGGSIRPIPQSDQMFRKTVWRTIDLREKQNRPMFSEGKEITRVIIEAVKRGELQAYKGDSLTSTYTPQEMKGRTSYEEEMGDVPDDSGWGTPAAASTRPTAAPVNDGWGTPAPAATASRTVRRARRDRNGRVMKDRRGQTIYETVAVTPPAPPAPKTNLQAYRYKDLFQMDIMENMVFDKKRSRMYHEIQTVTLFVPATAPGNKKTVDLPIATFRYRDLVKVFRNNPQTAIWFNSQNDAQHKNLADAFELWLFSSYITKVSNPSDSRLSDVYGSQRQGILAAQQTASDLVEYEYNLWSY